MIRSGRILIVASLLIAASVARGDDKSHRKAAEDLLLTMGVDKQLEGNLNQMLDIQLKSNPAMAPMKSTMQKFFSKHLSWDGLKDEFITIYADAFTEPELNDLTAFYKTPVGKKYVQKLPELTGKGMLIGAKRVQDNQAEFRTMLQEAAKKGAGGVDQ